MALLRSLGRLLGTGVFTAVETITLGVWLLLVDDAPTLSTVAATGAAVLLVGLVLEAIVNTVVVNGLGGLPLGPIAAFSATEAVIWIAWLAVADQLGGLTGIAIAGVVIFALMLPQHSIEDNALRGRPLASDILHPGTAAFTLVEAAAATVWLALVRNGDTILDSIDLSALPAAIQSLPADQLGLAALAILLLVEHLMGLQFALRNDQAGTGI